MDRRFFLATTAGGLAASIIPATAQPGGMDATHHGLVPGGPDDQAKALATALRTVSPNPLFLPPGRYRLSEVALPEGANIVGVPGATLFEHVGPGALLSLRGLQQTRLFGLSLESSGLAGEDAAPLVDGEDVSQFVMDECRIAGAPATALSLTRSGGRIHACRIERAGSTAIFALDSHGLEIASNTIEDCADNGILVWTSDRRDDGTIVQANRIARIGNRSGGSGQYGNGINVYRAGGVIVSNNRIDDCSYSAIRINAGTSCQIVGNNARRLGETGIYVEFAYDGAVVANNVVDGASNGISMTNLNEGGRLAACSGNLVRNMAEWPDGSGGIGIMAEADAALTGNMVEAAASTGILLGWGPYLRDVAATGNVVRDSGIGIGVSVAQGAGRALVANNLISGSLRGGILAMEWREVVGDLAADAGRYPHVEVVGNSVG